MKNRPNYRGAKEFLRAQIDDYTSFEGKPNLGPPVDDYTLHWALNEALGDHIGVTDGPTMVSPAGRCLMGPSDEDWAEMALWVFVSQSADQMERSWISPLARTNGFGAIPTIGRPRVRPSGLKQSRGSIRG